jgi:hypothetical protein
VAVPLLFVFIFVVSYSFARIALFFTDAGERGLERSLAGLAIRVLFLVLIRIAPATPGLVVLVLVVVRIAPARPGLVVLVVVFVLGRGSPACRRFIVLLFLRFGCGPPSPRTIVLVFVLLVLITTTASNGWPSGVIEFVFIVLVSAARTLGFFFLIDFWPLRACGRGWLFVLQDLEAGVLGGFLFRKRRRCRRLAAGHRHLCATLAAFNRCLVGFFVQSDRRPAFGADSAKGHGKT